jgi:hypothetical protein
MEWKNVAGAQGLKWTLTVKTTINMTEAVDKNRRKTDVLKQRVLG